MTIKLVHWRILVIALAISAFSAGWCSRSAYAFDPPNVPLYPPLSYRSAVVDEIKTTHRATYQIVDNYGWSNWHSIVQAALDTGSTYDNSLGNIYSNAVGSQSFLLREALPGETPTMLQVAETASAQQTHCNDTSGWSVACAYLLNPTPAPTYYKASTMQLYSFVDQAAVVEHETNHHISRACDQYGGGCPRKDGSGQSPSVACTGNPDTLMDCGPGAARFAKPYDIQVFMLATGFTVAPPVTCAFIGFDPCSGRIRYVDQLLQPISLDPNTGVWYLFDIPEWSPCDPAHPDIRVNLRLNIAVNTNGAGIYTFGLYWSFMPAC